MSNRLCLQASSRSNLRLSRFPFQCNIFPLLSLCCRQPGRSAFPTRSVGASPRWSGPGVPKSSRTLTPKRLGGPPRARSRSTWTGRTPRRAWKSAPRGSAMPLRGGRKRLPFPGGTICQFVQILLRGHMQRSTESVCKTGAAWMAE